MLFRYSRWDGTQRVDFDAEDLLDAMADDVLYDGDPWRAMRRLMQQGMQTPEGGKMPGLRDLLERLKRQRQQRLDRYDLGSSLDHIKKKLDQLIEQIGRQMAAMQSLMQSLTPDQRQQLDEMMRELMMRDERLEAAMRQLGMHLNDLLPLDELIQRYPFRGDEEVSLQEAMRLMEELQELDDLEREVRGVRSLKELQYMAVERVERLLGEESREDLERLRELSKRLEEAGYLERDGDELKLTARAIRKIGDKALRDIFTRLKRDRL